MKVLPLKWGKGCLADSNWNILCTDMRSDKFIGTAFMVSIYGRTHDIIFKYIEINSSGHKSSWLPQPTTTNQWPIFTLKVATFSSTWSSWILLHDRIQKIQSKLTLMKIFLMLQEDLSISRTCKVGNQQLIGAVQFCFHGFFSCWCSQLSDANSSRHVFC